jgi:hypothetical protein
MARVPCREEAICSGGSGASEQHGCTWNALGWRWGIGSQGEWPAKQGKSVAPTALATFLFLIPALARWANVFRASSAGALWRAICATIDHLRCELGRKSGC